MTRTPQFMFDANHFQIEATLDTTDSDKLSKLILQRRIIQSKVDSHITTGVP